jgi:hypothetical protein
MKSNPYVATSDANILDELGSGITETAEGIATPGQGHAVAEGFGQRHVGPLNQAESNLDQAAEVLRGAELNVDFTLSEQQITRMLEEARQQGKLGSSEAQRALLQDLTGPQLYQAWLKGRTKVNEAFANVPHKKIDPMELAQLIARSAEVTNVLEDFGIPATSGGMRKYSDVIDPNTGKSQVDELAEMLEAKGYNDTYFLLNDLRHKLSRRISSAYVAKDGDTAMQIELLRDGIDKLINKDYDPAIQRAMSTYKEFADTFLGTMPLKQYDAAAYQVQDMGDGTVRGQFDAHEAGGQAFIQSRNAYTDDYLTKFVLALQSGNPNASKEISQALVGEALNTLIKKFESGSRISSAELLTAIEPYARTLETTDRNLIQMWREGVESVRMAESGLSDAKHALDEAKATVAQIKEDAARGAFRFFLARQTNNNAVRSNSEDAFRQLFENTDSPTLIKEMRETLKKEKNVLALQGLEAEYLRWLRHRIFTKRSVGFTGDTDDAFVRDLSGARLQDALGSDYSHDMMLLKEIFADKPEMGQAVVEMMTLAHNLVNSRATKVNPFGSSTVVEGDLKNSVNALIGVTLGYLNPTAYKTRIVTGMLTKNSKEALNKAYENIFAQMVTNPDFISEALEAAAKGKPLKKFLGVLTKGMSRGALIEGTGGDEDFQTEEAFNVSEQEMSTMEQQAAQHTERPVERVATNLPAGYTMDEKGFIQRPGAIRTK